MSERIAAVGDEETTRELADEDTSQAGVIWAGILEALACTIREITAAAIKAGIFAQSWVQTLPNDFRNVNRPMVKIHLINACIQLPVLPL